MSSSNAAASESLATRRSRAVGVACLQMAGLAASNHVLTRLATWLPGFEGSRLHEDLPLFGAADTGDLVEALVLLAVVPGVLEELVFRGLVFGILRRVSGPRVAILGSALCFGLVHLDPHHVLIATALGLQLGSIRQLHGLGLAIAAHVTNNAVVLVARFLEEADGHGLPSVDSDEATFLIALVLAGSACAALWQRARSTPAAQTAPGSPLQTSPREDE